MKQPQELILIAALWLRYDHMERLTAIEAQLHPYFEPIREAERRNGTK
jgi:hypothetical protein